MERPLNQKKKLKVQKDLLDLLNSSQSHRNQVHVFVERFERADEDFARPAGYSASGSRCAAHLTALTDRLEHKQDERVKNNIKDTDASYEH